MGAENKLLRDAGGVPVVQHVIEAFQLSSVDQVLVVLRHSDPDLADLLKVIDASPKVLRVKTNGLGDTIAGAMSQIPPDMDGVLISPCDLPELSAADVDQVLSAAANVPTTSIVQPFDKMGVRGHPVYFGNKYFGALAELKGDTGAHEVIQDNARSLIKLQTTGVGVSLDLDTPQQWDTWQAGRPPND
jgi:molybdenum cofactor cytidylyltransferase